MDNNKKQRKIDLKLLSRIDSLPALENAHIHFIATSDKHEDEYYYWVLKSERLGFESTLSTQSGSILAVIPNIFLGSTLTMTVFLKSEKINNNIIGGFCSRILKEREKNKQDIFSTLSFIPRSDPHPFIGNAIWYDTQLEEMEELFFGNFYIVYVAIIGFNGNDVKGQFFIDDSPIGNPLILQVESNAIQTNCFISKRNIRANKTKSKLTFKLSSINQKDFFERNYSIFVISDCSNKKIIVPTNIQEVIVGPLRIIENNYHPCKYTAIIVKEIDPDEEGNIHQVKVFDEELSNKVIPFPIIGTSNKKILEIKALNYNVGGNKCSNINKHISGSGCWNIEVSYQYLTPSSVIPLYCIWPISNKCINHYKKNIDSCRHSKNVIINIFPDVKWEINFQFSLDLQKTVERPKWYENFEIGMSCEWNSFTAEAKLTTNSLTGTDFTLQEYVQTMIYNRLANYMKGCGYLMNFIYEFKAMFKNAQDDLKAIYKDDYPKLPKQRRIINFDIIGPENINLQLAWQTSVFAHNVGLKITGTGSGTLVNIDTTLDLLALASINSAVKSFVDSLDLALYIFDVNVEINVKINGSIDLGGNLSFDNAKRKSNGSIFVKGSVVFSLECICTHNPASNLKVSTEFSIEGKGEITALLELIPDEKGYKSIFSFSFDGLNAIGTIKNNVGRSKTKIIKKKDKTNVNSGICIISPKPDIFKKEFYIID